MSDQDHRNNDKQPRNVNSNVVRKADDNNPTVGGDSAGAKHAGTNKPVGTIAVGSYNKEPVAPKADVKEPNQGEGDRMSARVYNHHVRDYVAGGQVEPAAKSAESFVDTHPEQSRADERKAKQGPHAHPFIDVVARGKAMIERLRARFMHR
jgi:hypothetical protein